MTDANGNQISITSVTSTEDDWTDTSGRVVLRVVANPNWTTPSSIQYTYTDKNNSPQTITALMTALNIQTAFGCPGIAEFTSPNPAYVPSTITLPNARQYQIGYETNPNNPAQYTGRLSTIVLPSGGSYQYAYGAVNCSDGSPSGLTRTIFDLNTSQAFAYTHTVNGANAATTATTPAMPWDGGVANSTIYNFSNGLESSRIVNKGAAAMRSSVTTYSAQMPPFTVSTATTTGSVTSLTQTDFDGTANVTALREYYLGSAPNAGPLYRTTNISYLTGAPNNLANRPTQKVILDSSGTPKFKQVITYDSYGAGITCIVGALSHDDSGHGCSFVSRGNPTSVTTYANASAGTGAIAKNFTYDSLGNVRSADADCCVSQAFSFSGLTQYTQPDSVVSGVGPALTKSFTYNSANLPITMTDENNQTWHYDYDFFFRLTSVLRPDSSQIIINYDDPNDRYSVSTSVQGTDKNIETKQYDGLGRVVRDSISDVAGTVYSISDTQYDALNRVYRQSNPYTGSPQFWANFNYDPLNRNTLIAHPDGSTETNTYTNNVVISTDGAGKQRQYNTDAQDRVVTVQEPDPANGNSLSLITNYGYTVLDTINLVAQGAQGRGYNYDDAGRLTSTTNPESGTVTLVPNNFGLVTQKTDARGVITTFSYNGLNQLSGISYNVGSTGVAATPAVSFTYGSTPAQFNNGRLITMTDGPGTESYTYDLVGRTTSIARKVNNVTYTSQYGYNLASELTNLVYPSNRSVVQGYDKIGRLNLVKAGDNSVIYATNFAYDAAAHLTNLSYSNGVSAAYGFNPQNLQLATLGYATNTQTLFSASYGYAQNGGNNGQITRIVDNFQPGRSLTYSYDALNRLKTAVTDGSTSFAKWGLSWTYDRYGNRTAQTVTAGSAPSNSLGISANTNEIVGTTYDANGNMLNEPGLGGAYTYDAENRMLSAVISAHPVGTYTYSGVNLRTTRNVSGTLTTYIYNGNNVIAEYLNNAGPQSPGREYIYAGNKLIGTTSGTDLKYYHQDHQSIRLITDVNAAKVDDRGHYPYGELWYDNGSFSTKFVFTNYKRDTDESNNDYAINRMYSNRLGRFMQVDKLSGTYTNPQTFNLFAYVTNDPVNRLDPLGLYECGTSGADFCVTVSEPRGGCDADVCVYASPDPIIIGFVDPFAGAGFIPFDPGNLGGTYRNRRPIRMPAPKKPTIPSSNCAQSVSYRVTQGILGATNVTIAGLKTAALGGADTILAAATPFTGGTSAALAAIATTYGVVSIGGQALSGTGQLYTAFTGNTNTGEQISQAGDILSGPISGISILGASGGNTARAQRYASYESALTAGAGFVNSAGVKDTITSGVDAALNLFGLSGAGCRP